MIVPELEIAFVPADGPEATALIAALDLELSERYPEEPVHGIDAAHFARQGGLFAVGRAGGTAVACGALRPFEKGVELKRMFVMPAARRRGFARAMLNALEAEAQRRGYSRMLLETGPRQPEAIALYASSGWTRIAPFGGYADLTLSRCYEKRLSPAESAPV